MNIEVMERHARSARALDGRVALVTGSTSGIGLGVARALAESGARIVLNGFATADAIAAEIAGIENDFSVTRDPSQRRHVETRRDRGLDG